MQLYNTYKDHFEQIETGYGAHATDTYKALEKDRLAAIEAETAARTKYQEEYKKVSEAQNKANLDALVAAQMEVTRIKDIQKELGGEGQCAADVSYCCLPLKLREKLCVRPKRSSWKLMRR